MADLRVDLDAVTELGSSLTTVADEFENATTKSDRIADAVGHEGLAGVVRDFASSWDDTREKMTENLRLLADASVQVAQAFTDIDSDLADGISGEGAPAPARPGGPV
ncbi:hypothetical protein [Isoptericola cucumis]|uniref:Excreted virulence factor EspC (Type VII ESX diderm) n=1 Tax=Isoptericola cucumis TaxID=1776856 RepID=A0ABQ2BBC0_9MICO|nr:hypothetical protein [Isoptericola cucumis]GGI12211.1 hypothetical protein GCM10007368_40030 [Isoptericola cucumis]